jgi:hypothetical protein
MNEVLVDGMEAVPDPEGYASAGEVEEAIKAFDAVVWRAVEKVAKRIKITTRSKCWWTPELETVCKEKEKLARASYRQ